MMQPRALQVCPNDHAPFLELCKSHAAALERAGVSVDTVFLGAPRGERWDAATYFRIERGTRRMTGALKKYVATRGYGLVVAHRYRAHQVVTNCRRELAGATVVTIAHEFGMFARRRRRWRRRLFANDVYWAGVSQAVADEMQRHGVPALQTLVLPNPVDVARLDAERLSRGVAREHLGIPAAAAYVVGMVGRLHPKKRPQLALAGFSAVGGDTRMIFVGDGPLRGALETLAMQLGVAGKVHFAGHVADAARYANAFDVLVVSSVRQEAFGMALLEAMLAGVPVACADIPGPRSVLGPNGLYFDADSPDDLTVTLRRCAALSQAERTQLRDLQRARAEELFSLDAVAARYRAFFSTAAARLPAAS